CPSAPGSRAHDSIGGRAHRRTDGCCEVHSVVRALHFVDGMKTGSRVERAYARKLNRVTKKSAVERQAAFVQIHRLLRIRGTAHGDVRSSIVLDDGSEQGARVEQFSRRIALFFVEDTESSSRSELGAKFE